MSIQTLKEFRRARQAILRGMVGLIHAEMPDTRPGRSVAQPSQPLRPASQLPLRKLMTRDPITVVPETSLLRALDVLLENGLGALPVVDENRNIVGLLGEADVMKAFGETGILTVAAVMNTRPATVESDRPIEEVVDLLMANDLRRVLVREGPKLVGVVTRKDVMPGVLDVLKTRAKRKRRSSVAKQKTPRAACRRRIALVAEDGPDRLH